MIRSGPSLAAAFSSRPSARSRSLRHTLRPSITPSERIMSCGTRSKARSNCSAPRTRSRCTAATGSRRAAADCRADRRNRWPGRSESGPTPRSAAVGRLQGVRALLGQIERQHRLVDLHPLGPGLGQPPRLLHRPAAACPAGPAASASPPCTCPAAGRSPARAIPAGYGCPAPRLRETGRSAWSRRAELHARLELGHQVVVVRVEPLGHVQGRFLGAAGHGEIGGQVDRPAAQANRFGTAPTMAAVSSTWS